MAELIADDQGDQPDVKVAYHTRRLTSRPIIPELIEIGVDVLNPVQPAAWTRPQLKREYGDRLCFWGSIDEQRTLPFGTPGRRPARGPRPAARPWAPAAG